MIGIQNVGKIKGDQRKYELWIFDGKEKLPISSFTHFRKDGLATCLRKAANSIKKGKADEESPSSKL